MGVVHDLADELEHFGLHVGARDAHGPEGLGQRPVLLRPPGGFAVRLPGGLALKRPLLGKLGHLQQAFLHVLRGYLADGGRAYGGIDVLQIAALVRYGLLADRAVAPDVDVALGVASDRGRAAPGLALPAALAHQAALFEPALKFRVLLVLESVDLGFEVALLVQRECGPRELLHLHRLPSRGDPCRGS